MIQGGLRQIPLELYEKIIPQISTIVATQLAARSWKLFVAQNPVLLLLCIGNGKAARCSNRFQGVLWIPAYMDERTGRSNGRSPNAPSAMYAYTNSGVELVC